MAVNTQSLLMDGIRRIDEMSLFKARIPGPGTLLRRREPRRVVPLNAGEQQLLSLVDGTRTVAELALARNRWFTPHTWTNGIGPLANLHVAAGVGGGPYLEFPTRPAGRRSAATSCSKSRSGSTGRGGSPSRACRAWESGSRRRPSGPSTRPPNRPRRRHPARATLWTQRDFLPPPQTRTR